MQQWTDQHPHVYLSGYCLLTGHCTNCHCSKYSVTAQSIPSLHKAYCLCIKPIVTTQSILTQIFAKVITNSSCILSSVINYVSCNKHSSYSTRSHGSNAGQSGTMCLWTWVLNERLLTEWMFDVNGEQQRLCYQPLPLLVQSQFNEMSISSADTFIARLGCWAFFIQFKVVTTRIQHASVK